VQEYRTVALEGLTVATPSILLLNKAIHAEAIATLRKSPFIFSNVLMRMCLATGLKMPDLFPAATLLNVE
jgi:hypothetical protein